MHALTVFLALAGLSAASAAAAQVAPAATGADTSRAGSTAIGIVFDSVRLKPLTGAIIRVDSGPRFTTADAQGRFRLDSVPPGRHFLRVEHPMLDTLGVMLRSPTENYTPGSAHVAELATPSPETLIGMVCSAAWRARGPAALMGRVREADTGHPAAGAKVSLVWYEITVTSGVKRVPRVREATVSADGTYRVCGLPAQLEGKIQVINGPLTSGEISINFGNELLFLRSMSIANPAALIAAATDTAAGAPLRVVGTARLTGRVLNAAGQPIPNARVQLEGSERVATTRATGDFLLDSLPPGTQTVTARHLGYAPIEQAVDLVSAEPRTVTLRMSDYVPILETVRVTAARERALDQVGFARRKRQGMGTFLEGDEINQQSRFFSDVLRTVPGVRVQPTGYGRQVVTSTRGPNGCVMFFVDGTPWQSLEPGDIDDFVKPHELAAIEVYSSSQAPAEFTGARGGGCTVIVGWTHRRLDRARR